MLKRILSGKLRVAGDLLYAIQTIDWLADDPIGFTQLVAIAVRRKPDDRLHNFCKDTHFAPPCPDRSLRTLTIMRLASSTLKLLNL